LDLETLLPESAAWQTQEVFERRKLALSRKSAATGARIAGSEACLVLLPPLSQPEWVRAAHEPVFERETMREYSGQRTERDC